MDISKKVQEQMENSSWIRRMFEQGIELKKTYGEKNVFDLSLGNPIVNPPKKFFEMLRDLSNSKDKNVHKYMPNAGFYEVREEVAKSISKESGLPFKASDIVMTVGAAGAINTLFRSILDPGDEVIIISPFFAEYIFYIEHQNGNYRICDSDENWMPNLKSLENNIGKKTKAILINSPNNPSGVIYSKEILEKMSSIIKNAEKKYSTSIYLISDEPYRKIIYSNNDYPFIYKYHERSVVATSHSKDLGLAGERIGYIAVNPSYTNKIKLIDAIIFSLRTLGFVNAPALMQRVVAKLQDEVVDVNIYRKKRDLLYENLIKIGYDCVKPDGAFYLFPKSPIPNDEEFVKILQKELVLVVPGIGFGTKGFFRASYCVEDWVIEGSLDGFNQVLKQINS